MPKPGQKDHILAKGHKLYTVKQGDTLWSISKNECGGKGSAWKDTVLAYNQWLIDEGR
ncbi:LysM peptidoglycan-binding domain-containing protein [Rickettsia bellii]|nr:LysM peptidoglycan-binding domain-containing protein [Rickettsia bellii]